VLRYVHLRDAKASLVSHLLKHYVVAKTLSVPFAETPITRNRQTKPVHVTPEGAEPVVFNVSHQSDVVALVGVARYGGPGPVDVGVDVVSPAERRDRDHRIVRDEGWPSFVDMHADVFGRGEPDYLKYQILTRLPPPAAATAASRGPTTAEALLDFKLRAFYTLWCLREAYVKMTGDALLAPWLADLQFRNFVPPAPTESLRGEEQEGGREEEKTDCEIWFKGRRVDDANVCIRAFGPDYMICAAARTPEKKEDALAFPLGRFEWIDIDDILEFADPGTL